MEKLTKLVESLHAENRNLNAKVLSQATQMEVANKEKDSLLKQKQTIQNERDLAKAECAEG